MQKHHDRDFWVAPNAAEGDFKPVIFAQPPQPDISSQPALSPFTLVGLILVLGLVGGFIKHLASPDRTRDSDLPPSPPKL